MNSPGCFKKVKSLDYGRRLRTTILHHVVHDRPAGRNGGFFFWREGRGGLGREDERLDGDGSRDDGGDG